ncbi:MAG: YIP1 family protein [Candidatus Aminicenantes bacterium]|nr:MAG: YIP1 family protein [Candidatus Aminicenantes bacterium]
MDVVARVQRILLRPKEEWLKIKEETFPISELFTSYVLILAAIPAAAQFIGYGIIGYRVPFLGWHRLGIGTSLFRAVLAYVFSLVAVFVLGIVINALAPSFSSTQNSDNAMKLAVYSMTPAWVAGGLHVFYFLSPLVILGSLYGIYILYLGLMTPLMNTPKEKVASYLIVSFVIAVVVIAVLGVILNAIFTVGSVYRAF